MGYTSFETTCITEKMAQKTTETTMTTTSVETANCGKKMAPTLTFKWHILLKGMAQRGK